MLDTKKCATLIVAFIIYIGLMGCKEDEDNGDNNNMGGTSTTHDASAGGNHCLGRMGNDGAGNNTLTGVVYDNINKNDIQPGLTVEVLDNDSGQKVGKNTVTGSDGSFSFTGLDDGLVGLMVVGTEADATGQPRVDTLTFNVPTNAKDRDIYSGMLSITELITDLLETSDSPEVAAVSGGVYYYDKDCNEWPVNCATVEIDRAGDLWYFGKDRMPDKDATETSENGIFLLTDTEITEEKVTITTFVDGQPAGSISMPLIAPKFSTDGQDNTHITRVYVEQLGNPTPDCVL